MPQDRWIQHAKIRKGVLRKYVRRNYGDKGFTKKGTIKVSILRELIRSKHTSETTKRRARLALKFRRFSKKK